MNLCKTLGLVTGAATTAFAGASFAEAPSTSRDADARIGALEAQIDQIRREQRDWLQADDEELRALIAETLSDSRTRRSFLENGGGAGINGEGAYIESSDGTFRLEIGLMTQPRAVYNDREGDAPLPGGDDGSIFGFENTRTEVEFRGHVTENGLFKVEYSFSDQMSAGANLEEAWLAWKIRAGERPFYIAWGQQKVPFLWESLIDPEDTLTAERSQVAYLLGAGAPESISQGISAWTETDNLRLQFAFTDGAAPNPTGLNGSLRNTAWQNDTNEYAFTGRVDWLFDGAWEDTVSQTGWSTNAAPFTPRVGAAAHYQDSASGTMPPGGLVEAFLWTVDGSLEWDNGANVFASFTGNHGDFDSGMGDFDQYGLVVQGGLHVIPDEWEIFARWEWVDFDDAFGAGAEDEFSAITGGFTYYRYGQNLKFTTDILFALDENQVANGYTGLLLDAAGEDSQWVLRSQMTLNLR